MSRRGLWLAIAAAVVVVVVYAKSSEGIMRLSVPAVVIRGMLELYVIYAIIHRGSRKVRKFRRQGATWKALAFGVLGVLGLTLYPVIIWYRFHMTDFAIVTLGTALVTGYVIGLAAICLERHYYPDA